MTLQVIENVANPSLTMKSKGKMGHNDGTQSPLDPMPKHPHVLKRDGRYYYRKRIPADLVQAACYGKAKDIKRALGTSDLATANRLAITEALKVDEEFRTKRRELGQPRKNARTCKSEGKRKFSEISEMERSDFLIRYFITKERNAADIRGETDPEIRTQLLWNVRDDLAGIDADLTDPQSNWLLALSKALEADGITTEGADNASLRELAVKMKRAALEAAARTESALRGHPFKTFDHLFKDLHAESPLPSHAVDSKTIGDLCHDYMAYNETRAERGKLARSTIPKIEMRCRIMADFFGNGNALAAISREDATRLADFLQTIPSNASKRYKGLSLVTAAESEARLQDKRLIHAETADDYLSGLTAMLNYAVELGWIKNNPLKGRLIRERLPKLVRRDRQTLTPDEMTLVFSSPDFLKQKSGELAARFWVPLLCLFHGTRANEVAGIHVTDVREDAEIFFLNLQETEERRLKNETSVRLVPLHQELIDMGFLKFVAKRREEDSTGYLFPGLSRNSNGSMADGIGKWWQRLVKSTLGPPPVNGPTGARGIHSLRHSWVNAARSSGMDDSTRKRLGGWSNADASDGYGWSGALPMLKAAIDKIVFPDVEFPSIRRVKRD
jgi:integrase